MRTDTPNIIDERRFEIFRSMAQSEIGVLALLDYCNEHEIVPPPWARLAAVDLLCDLIKRERTTRRGRSGGIYNRFRQDLIDAERHNEVYCIREKQRELADSTEVNSTPDPSDPSVVIERRQQHVWFGSSLDRACEIASLYLAKTRSFGSKDAIEASFRRVEASRQPPFRHTVLDFSVLKKLGLEEFAGMRPFDAYPFAPWRPKALAK